MGAEIVSKSSNHGRQRNLVLESRIDFYGFRRFFIAINDHAESSDHNRDHWIIIPKLMHMFATTPSGYSTPLIF